jgi:hypothetical protein
MGATVVGRLHQGKRRHRKTPAVGRSRPALRFDATPSAKASRGPITARQPGAVGPQSTQAFGDFVDESPAAAFETGGREDRGTIAQLAHSEADSRYIVAGRGSFVEGCAGATRSQQAVHDARDLHGADSRALAGSNRRPPPGPLCGQTVKSLCLSCFPGSDQVQNAPKLSSFGDELVTSFAGRIGPRNRERPRDHLLAKPGNRLQLRYRAICLFPLIWRIPGSPTDSKKAVLRRVNR